MVFVGTDFSESAEGGIIKCRKPTSGRTLSWYVNFENRNGASCLMIFTDCKRTSHIRAWLVHVILQHVRQIITYLTSGLDGDQDESYGRYHAENELTANPIKDKYYVPPSDPAAIPRATEFAQEKGFLNPRKGIVPSVETSNSRRPSQVH